MGEKANAAAETAMNPQAVQENQEPQTGEKTFTQDELNNIISRRLSEEKAKADAELERKQQELTQRELRMDAKEMLTKRDLPLSLLDVLNYSDRETMEKCIGILREAFYNWKKPEIPAQFTYLMGRSEPAGEILTPLRAAMLRQQ